MRSYGQFCALARALDVVGDRWTLLIIRELAARPCRFRDVADGLPGIATNLLADRLRLLTVEGIVAHDAIGGTYQLTERGRGLGGALKALVRWGIPLMASGQGTDESRVHWLSLAISAIFEETTLSEPVRVQVVTGSDEIEIVAHQQGTDTRIGNVLSPDVILRGPHELILGALSGDLSLESAEETGLVITGSRAALRTLIAARRYPRFDP